MKLFVLVALFGLSFAQHNPNARDGRTAIVHLFEWRWADIAAECERFLGPKGFAGVQVGRCCGFLHVILSIWCVMLDSEHMASGETVRLNGLKSTI